MGSSLRSATGSRASVRQGTRMVSSRHASAMATRIDRAGAVSPAASIASTTTIGAKRKERDFDADAGVEETNINVVVRCRGRNEREVRENSNVVVRTDTVKGKNVELSMGPNAISNRSYNFDRVFSQAADQNMVFDDTVKPILDEVGFVRQQSRLLLTISPTDAHWIQLHNLRLRPDGHRKDVYHVR